MMEQILSHGACFAPCKYCSISNLNINLPRGSFKFRFRFYFLFYVTFNSQGHIAMGRLQVEETSAYGNVNHAASASNYRISNMEHPP